MNPKQKRRLFTGIGIFLSLTFLYFCFHSLDREQLLQALTLPHPWFLLVALAINGLTMMARTEVWRVLLNPIQRISYWTLFDILHIGYMANNLLPLKAGEFFRASFVAKKWKLPYTQVLTSVGLERYFTGFSLILLFLWIASRLDMPLWIKSGVYVLVAVLTSVQIALTLLWKKKPNLKKWEQRHPLLYRSIETLSHIGEGSYALRSGKTFLLLTSYALVTWIMQIATLQATEAAFGIDTTWIQSAFVVTAVNLAISLPSAPGNLGTFELASVLAFGFLGLDKASALAVGIFFHLIQVIPVTLVGLFYFFRWGLRFKDMEAGEELAGAQG